MTGFAARLTTTLVLAGLALAGATASGAAAGPARTPILGVMPHAGGQRAAAPLSLSKAVEAAGPTTLTFDSSYQTLIDRYFADVAHDSGGTTNVYSVATQYSDGSGAIQYQSTVGGSYVDRDPLPANGCSDNLDTYCLTDLQLENEIQSVLTATGWQGGLDHIFFLMTPNGVGSCFNGVSGQCSTDGGASFLKLTSNPGTPVPDPSPDATWGLHLLDANVALGDLVKLIATQARAFAAR